MLAFVELFEEIGATFGTDQVAIEIDASKEWSRQNGLVVSHPNKVVACSAAKTQPVEPPTQTLSLSIYLSIVLST